MYAYTQPYSIKKIIPIATLVDTAQNIEINARTFIISNTGAQPLYFKEKTIDSLNATASNGFLVPANTVLQIILTASTLSIISNATGTSASILILDM